MSNPIDSQDELFFANVRTLARYLYVIRGFKEGQDEENWLEAEKQLKAYMSTREIKQAVNQTSQENIDRLLKAIKEAPELRG